MFSNLCRIFHVNKEKSLLKERLPLNFGKLWRFTIQTFSYGTKVKQTYIFLALPPHMIEALNFTRKNYKIQNTAA